MKVTIEKVDGGATVIHNLDDWRSQGNRLLLYTDSLGRIVLSGPEGIAGFNIPCYLDNYGALGNMAYPFTPLPPGTRVVLEQADD